MKTFDGIKTFKGCASFMGMDIDPSTLSPRNILIEDIAHSLSLQCRYMGHCSEFYSIAQHSLLVCENASKELKLTALLHDAAEAYLLDVARPLKPYFQPKYGEISRKIENLIADKFNLLYPFPEEIHELDARAIKTESLRLFGTHKRWKHAVLKSLPKIKVDCGGDYQDVFDLDLCETEHLFLLNFQMLREDVGR